MAMKSEKFNTVNDFELAPSKKKRQATYEICNTKKNNGLVIYIPGFGADLGGYTAKFCSSIAEKYNDLSVMCVDYFCMKSRPMVGAKIEFEYEDKLKLGNDFLFLNTDQILQKLNIKTKNSKLLSQFSCSLVPPDEEYQNFGLMAALDILNGLQHAVDKYELDANNIILIGSSYGGYVANLVTKIAPGYIKAVFDNSSWAKPNLAYIVGREINTPEFSQKLNEHCILAMFVKTPWSLKPSLPSSFEKEKIYIRSFSESDLNKMSDYGGNKTLYFFAHAENDRIANTSDKIKMVKSMINNDFIVKMDVFDETDIDGKLIKNLNHGMGLSMVQFFKLGLEFVEKVNLDFIRNKDKLFEYEYSHSKYIFDLSHKPIKCELIVE